MGAQHSLIVEIEDAIQSCSSEKRVETLRRVTDLFLNGTDRLNEVADRLAKWAGSAAPCFSRQSRARAASPSRADLAPLTERSVELTDGFRESSPTAKPPRQPRRNHKFGRPFLDFSKDCKLS